MPVLSDMYVRDYHLAQVAARTENTKGKHGEGETSALLEHVLNDLDLKRKRETLTVPAAEKEVMSLWK